MPVGARHSGLGRGRSSPPPGSLATCANTSSGWVNSLGPGSTIASIHPRQNPCTQGTTPSIGARALRYSRRVAARRIDDAAGREAVAVCRRAGFAADRVTTALAVRWSLQLLAQREPGRAVEVRVPPYGAVQMIAGQRHTRGTPPNLIETDPATWLRLVTGDLGWAVATDSGAVRASGTRAALGHLLP